MSGTRPKLRAPAVFAASTLCLLTLPAVAWPAEPKLGAYCPLPEPGQPAQCLTDAKTTYSGFFTELSEGNVSDAQAAQLEADVVAGRDTARTYDALSSLTYAYYLLARRAAEDPRSKPGVAARLERWNAVLARAYAASGSETRYRRALREAATDLDRKAPRVDVACTDAEGRPAQCRSTQLLLRELDDVRDHSGVRGQISRLLGRLIGSSP